MSLTRSANHNRIYNATPYLCLKTRLSTIIFHELVLYIVLLYFIVWLISGTLRSHSEYKYDTKSLNLTLEVRNVQVSNFTEFSLPQMMNTTLTIVGISKTGHVDLINESIASGAEMYSTQAEQWRLVLESSLSKLNETVYLTINDSISQITEDVESDMMSIKSLLNYTPAYDTINAAFESTLASFNHSMESSNITAWNSSKSRLIDTISEIHDNHSLIFQKFFTNLSNTVNVTPLNYSLSVLNKTLSDMNNAPSTDKLNHVVMIEYIVLSILIFIIIVSLSIWSWVQFRFEVTESDALYDESVKDPLIPVHHIIDPLVCFITRCETKFLQSDKQMSLKWLNSALFGERSNLNNLIRFTVFTAFGYIFIDSLIRHCHIVSSGDSKFVTWESLSFDEGSIDQSSLKWLAQRYHSLTEKYTLDVNSFFSESLINVNFNQSVFDGVMYELANLKIPSLNVSLDIQTQLTIPYESDGNSILNTYKKVNILLGYISLTSTVTWCCFSFLFLIIAFK